MDVSAFLMTGRSEALEEGLRFTVVYLGNAKSNTPDVACETYLLVRPYLHGKGRPSETTIADVTGWSDHIAAPIYSPGCDLEYNALLHAKSPTCFSLLVSKWIYYALFTELSARFYV